MYDDSSRAELGEPGFFGPTKPSDRELRNSCPDENIQQLSAKIKSLDNCICENATENTTCSFVCSSLQSSQEMKAMCLDSIKVAAGVDKDKEQAERLALLSSNVKSLRTLQERLVDEVCTPGSSLCNGKVKDDSLVISALKAKVEAGVNACSETPVPKGFEEVAEIIKAKPVPVVVQKKAELAGEKVAARVPENAVPISDLPADELPKSSTDAVSFFKGIFHKLTFGLFT